MRPRYFDRPEAGEACTSKSEYVFGDQLITTPLTQPVNPVTQLAKSTRWIPEGDWFEWPTGTALRDPLTLDRSFSIAQIPPLARAGSIIPMQPPALHVGEKPLDPLILTIFPLSDGQASHYRLYEDNNDGEKYRRGICRWTPISATQVGDTLSNQGPTSTGSTAGRNALRFAEDGS